MNISSSDMNVESSHIDVSSSATSAVSNQIIATASDMNVASNVVCDGGVAREDDDHVMETSQDGIDNATVEDVIVPLIIASEDSNSRIDDDIHVVDVTPVTVEISTTASVEDFDTNEESRSLMTAQGIVNVTPATVEISTSTSVNDSDATEESRSFLSARGIASDDQVLTPSSRPLDLTQPPNVINQSQVRRTCLKNYELMCT